MRHGLIRLGTQRANEKHSTHKTTKARQEVNMVDVAKTHSVKKKYRLNVVQAGNTKRRPTWLTPRQRH